MKNWVTGDTKAIKTTKGEVNKTETDTEEQSDKGKGEDTELNTQESREASDTQVEYSDTAETHRSGNHTWEGGWEKWGRQGEDNKGHLERKKEDRKHTRDDKNREKKITISEYTNKPIKL